MKYVPAAIVCLIVTSIWYLLHDVDYLAENVLGYGVASLFYESAVYAAISLFANVLHNLCLIWIAYAFWWRLKNGSK